MQEWPIQTRPWKYGSINIMPGALPKEKSGTHHALYTVNGRLLIVIRELDKSGWDIFIPASTGANISATLKAVEVACGLQPE
jgi:hypothetical protein